MDKVYKIINRYRLLEYLDKNNELLNYHFKEPPILKFGNYLYYESNHIQEIAQLLKF